MGESLSFFVGVVGNIISVLMFLAPVPTFVRIVRHKSTESFKSLPYVCTLLNSSLWTYYGLVKTGEWLVSTVNGFGILVEAVYVALFLIYAPRPMKIKTGILVGIVDVGMFGVTIGVTRIALHGSLKVDGLGLVCAALNIVMYASPLSAMKTVVTTRSVEYMPFWLSFFMFLNGGLWTFYAVLNHDYFLGVPNGTGFVLGCAQLILYAMYVNARPRKEDDLTHTLIEDGTPQTNRFDRLKS